MSFPETKRTVYRINPLVEVVTQLRFPTILKIKNSIPDTLQDSIRDSFPKIETVDQQYVKVRNLEGNSDLEEGKNRIYNFFTEDNEYAFSVSSDYIALSAIVTRGSKASVARCR